MKTLFLCSANVGRSQIAEGYYNHFTHSDNGYSAALVEDRREKYNSRPAKSVREIMAKDGVDISTQRVKLLTKAYCDEAERIIVLLTLHPNQESEFSIDGISPTKFLLDDYRDKLKVRSIQDPFGETEETLKHIRNEIQELVLELV